MTVMSWDEWVRHDATALAAEVRAGRVTPQELAEQAAEGVARLNPKVNAVIEVFADTLANPGHGPSKQGWGALWRADVPQGPRLGADRADAGFRIGPDARHGPEGHRSHDRELPSCGARASRPLEHAGIRPDLRYPDQV